MPIALLAVGWAFPACRAPESSPLEARVDAPDPRATALVASYRAAHEGRDVAALKLLLHPTNVSPVDCEVILAQFTRCLGLTIRTIEFLPLARAQGFDLTDFPNRNLVGWLAAAFVPPPEDARFFEAAFSVEELDEEYFLVVAEPRSR